MKQLTQGLLALGIIASSIYGMDDTQQCSICKAIKQSAASCIMSVQHQEYKIFRVKIGNFQKNYPLGFQRFIEQIHDENITVPDNCELINDASPDLRNTLKELTADFYNYLSAQYSITPRITSIENVEENASTFQVVLPLLIPVYELIQ